MAASNIPQPVVGAAKVPDTRFFRLVAVVAITTSLALLLVDQSKEKGLEHVEDLPGYWGPATATLDWCESNYVVSYYIAEFYNTLSNAAYLIAALVGVSLHRNS